MDKSNKFLMDAYTIFTTTQCERVSDGSIAPILGDCSKEARVLVLVLPQLEDFDSLEYAWWVQQECQKTQGLVIRAVEIGDSASTLAEHRASGQQWEQVHWVPGGRAICRSQCGTAP